MFDRFLDWFERHKFGVIGTLMLHTMLMFAFAISTLKTKPPRNEPPPLVLEMEIPPAELLTEQQQAEMKEASAAQEVTNRTSNLSAEPEQPLSRATSRRMNEGIEEDLHNMEQAEFQRLADERKAEGKEVTMPTLDPSKFDKRNYQEQEQRPAKVEGSTTVSYDLVGRTDITLEVPAYLCTGHGRVAVKVAVDRSGVVKKAELDPAATTTNDDCMIGHALSSASSARFSRSSSAQDPQRGTITYIFLAQ